MTAHTATIAVVANPAGAEQESTELRTLLENRHLDVEWYETTPDDAGVGQTRRAMDNGADVVIACGGDGTVRSCLEATAGTATSVGIIPGGTGNLLARNLGVPKETAEALDVILAGRQKRIDLGYVNDEAFAVMAGIGLDARIMQETGRESKERFGTAAYVATTARHLEDHLFSVVVSLDGSETWEGAATSILVANHGRLQGDIALFPDAKADDGKLDVLVASARTLRDWTRTAWAVLRNDPSLGPIERFVGTTISIDTIQPIPYQLDGDERPPAKQLTFTAKPAAATVFVPAEDTP